MWFWRVILPGAGVVASLTVLAVWLRADDPRARPAARPLPPAREVVVAEGLVVAGPGGEVTVGTASGGEVVGLPAREKARVRKGDLLVKLRSDDQEAALAEAEAHLAEAEAELAFLKREYQRRVRAPTDSLSYATELDAARRDHAVADTRRQAAVAVVAQCRSALAQTRVTAPIDGVVTACLVQPGETVPPASRLVTVCDLSRTRVEAEVDEFDAPRVAPGAAVTVAAEGYGDASWRGTVEEIPDRVADRTVRPEDPGRPTDTRVLLVKIALPQPHPLKLGQRVEVAIQATPKPAADPER
jgi:RND family efflux transporter MFP subunit